MEKKNILSDITKKHKKKYMNSLISEFLRLRKY